VNIGEAAELSGVSAKMIRHYEAIGLAPLPSRSEGGYRVYSDQNVHTLAFIRRARDLGFSIAQMTELVALWGDRDLASAEVRRIAMEHVALLEQKAKALGEMAKTLKHLAGNCRGARRPECPIIEGVAADIPAPAKAPAAGLLAGEHLLTVAVRSRMSTKAAASKTTSARKQRRTA
jgi:MerR family transcriptional regulator, copper efflux regulator